MSDGSTVFLVWIEMFNRERAGFKNLPGSFLSMLLFRECDGSVSPRLKRVMSLSHTNTHPPLPLLIVFLLRMQRDSWHNLAS